ncbi:hypothetical protein [Nocardioides cynanchi]|uniref:hypothetical protein n=1 Tax=Nocardioides cynanchi TaxID=2558918 RepID=UPI0012477B82|nr:hypothetical protein [Nocardioides cynanchi]
MDWTRLDVDGRVTALRGDVCAGITADGAAFVALLTGPEPGATVVDAVDLDSFGVIGLSGDDATWLTGRGADGQLHLWQVAAPHVLGERSLETTGAAWAAPVLDTRATAMLVATLADGGWRLRAHAISEGARDGEPRGRALRLGGPPDAALAFGFHAGGPITVAGLVGDADDPPVAAWLVDPEADARTSDAADWRRVHLSPAPSELSSVGVGAGGRRTWVAGRHERKPVVYEILSLPFRGLVRSTTLTLPVLTLSDAVVDGPDRPVVLVDSTDGDHPVFLVATVDGNRLCWNAEGTWKAHPVPDGRLRAAGLAGGRIHVLVDSVVWSLPDPTGG